MFIAAGLGVSPWTVLAQGVSVQTGWTVGFSTFAVSVAVLVVVDTPKRGSRFWNSVKRQS